MKRITLTWVLAVLCGWSECKKIYAASNSTSRISSSSDDSSLRWSSSRLDPNSSEDNDLALKEKVNSYVECYDLYAKRVWQIRDQYASSCGDCDGIKTPASKHKDIQKGVLELSYPTLCIEKIKKAKETSPMVPELEGAGDAYLDALKELYPMLKETYSYYKRKHSLEDNRKKGRNLHNTLMAGFQKFEEARDTFDRQIDIVQEQLDQREISRYKKRADMLRFLIASMYFQAKQSLAMLENKDGKLWDLEQYSKKIGDFDKMLEELSDYIDLANTPIS